MGNPEELLEAARRLWYSDKDAQGAQQILGGIMRDCPDSPEAEEARELRNLIAQLQPLGGPDSDREEGWRYTAPYIALVVVFCVAVIFIPWRWEVEASLVRLILSAVFIPFFILLTYVLNRKRR